MTTNKATLLLDLLNPALTSRSRGCITPTKLTGRSSGIPTDTYAGQCPEPRTHWQCSSVKKEQQQNASARNDKLSTHWEACKIQVPTAAVLIQAHTVVINAHMRLIRTCPVWYTGSRPTCRTWFRSQQHPWRAPVTPAHCWGHPSNCPPLGCTWPPAR